MMSTNRRFWPTAPDRVRLGAYVRVPQPPAYVVQDRVAVVTGIEIRLKDSPQTPMVPVAFVFSVRDEDGGNPSTFETFANDCVDVELVPGAPGVEQRAYGFWPRRPSDD